MAIRPRLIGAVALTLFATLMLAGCTAADTDSPEVDGSSEGAPQAVSADGRDAFPEGFPIEVPAMDGEVTAVETRDAGLGPWMYRMQAPYGKNAIAAWYRQAYTGRSWTVVDEASSEVESVLVLAKGSGAWSTVRITTIETGSRIECWTGIGVPMPPEALPPTNIGESEV